MIDMGDADIIHTDTEGSHANIEYGVRKALDASALPVTIGGDHSINIPCVSAFEDHCETNGPIHILQIDAHLDFVDERHGVRHGHGNPMRRAAEKDYVTGLTQLGIRNVSSTAKEGYEAAREMGSDILSVRQVRKLGVEAVLARLPKDARLYGGFLYYEVLEVLQGAAQNHQIVGIDLVEVAPDYDPTASTQILAAQLLMNFIGFIFHAKAERS